MDLPVMPPVQPMLAATAAQIPPGQQYEPKWDGFRAIIFRDGDDVHFGSRNTKPIQRYFPELVAAVRAALPQRCVLDGEVVVQNQDGVLDFSALQQRIHPAESRIKKLALQTPATLLAFDCLALDDKSLLNEPLVVRRRALERAIGAEPIEPERVALTPVTSDIAIAQEWFTDLESRGIEGIVAKDFEMEYRPGERVMTKIKHVRTADCVVAGFRPYKGDAQAVGSLLLGLYTEAGELASVGIIGSFSQRRRRELFGELQPLVTPLRDHPWAPIKDDDTSAASVNSASGGVRKPQDAAVSRWSGTKNLEFVPLRPERVVEVKYDRMEGDRFRHTTQFVRWRTDRDPQSCTFAQLPQP